MDLLPNWTLTFDPTVYTTDNASFGLLAKWQRDLTPMRTTLLAGVDVDLSPGARVEDIVRPQTSASGLPSGRPIFSSYTTRRAYLRLRRHVRVRLALRPGRLLADAADARQPWRARRPHALRLRRPAHLAGHARHRRPADAVRTFTPPQPEARPDLPGQRSRSNLFASYRHAFRAPSEGQLFRQGSARNTIDLEPVTADNLEVGLRARAPARGSRSRCRSTSSTSATTSCRSATRSTGRRRR